MKKDMKMVMVDLKNLKNRVSEMIEAGQDADKKLYEITDEEQHKMLKVFKGVSKMVGSSDIEITLLKVSISSLMEEVTTLKKEDNCVEEVQENEKEMKTSQQCESSHLNREDTKVTEGSYSFNTSKDVVDEAEFKEKQTVPSVLKKIKETTEVDKLLEKKTLEKPKLARVCESSSNKKQGVSRVRDGLNRQIVKSRERTSVQPGAGAEKISTLVSLFLLLFLFSERHIN